jgi:hypothetical protein
LLIGSAVDCAIDGACAAVLAPKMASAAARSVVRFMSQPMVWSAETPDNADRDIVRRERRAQVDP